MGEENVRLPCPFSASRTRKDEAALKVSLVQDLDSNPKISMHNEPQTLCRLHPLRFGLFICKVRDLKSFSVRVF